VDLEIGFIMRIIIPTFQMLIEKDITTMSYRKQISYDVISVKASFTWSINFCNMTYRLMIDQVTFFV